MPPSTRPPFGNITNMPASNTPASGPAKASNDPDATQTSPTAGASAGPATDVPPATSGSNAYEAAGVAWQKKTQAEKEAIYMKTFGSKEPPWANDTDEPVDDGADLDYEYGPQ